MNILEIALQSYCGKPDFRILGFEAQKCSENLIKIHWTTVSYMIGYKWKNIIFNLYNCILQKKDVILESLHRTKQNPSLYCHWLQQVTLTKQTQNFINSLWCSGKNLTYFRTTDFPTVAMKAANSKIAPKKTKVISDILLWTSQNVMNTWTFMKAVSDKRNKHDIAKKIKWSLHTLFLYFHLKNYQSTTPSLNRS